MIEALPVTAPIPAPVRVVLVSVGGSPAPVLFTLRRHRPAHIWYFCSAGSRQIADTIHAGLDWRPDRDIIETERFEELGPCFRELRAAIPSLLRKWRVQPGEVLVDYTGGTKTMSAALVLAATELFDQFGYVGGEQREKGGLGVTINGMERAYYQGNPWTDLAVREIDRARGLWAGCLFDAAARVLLDTAARVPQRVRFETVANVAQAMAARHRLDFSKAQKFLGPALRTIPALYDGEDDAGLCEFARGALEICAACGKDSAGAGFLRELLDNALRTASQGRHEDAAARLYRAMEMQGQLWLDEASGGAFHHGRLGEDKRLPPPLAGLDCCRPNLRGEVRLGLEQIYLALHALGDPRAARVAADLTLGLRSRWRDATEKRNASILAHGIKPIGEEGFHAMKQIAADFLGFDLERQGNPIPALDDRWF